MTARPNPAALSEMDAAIRDHNDLAERALWQVRAELPGATLETVVFWVSCSAGPITPAPAVHREHSEDCRGFGLVIARHPETLNALDQFKIQRGHEIFSKADTDFLNELHTRYMVNV